MNRLSSLKIGGLDPSLSNFGMVKGTLCMDTGVFALEDLNLATSSVDKKAKTVRKNSQDLDRAESLAKAMKEFFRDIDYICVEVPVGSQSARAMTSYGVCIGLLAYLRSEGKTLIQVTPNEVKLVATGSKTASKQDMINWATSNYPDAPWITRMVKGVKTFNNSNEHLADAVAALHAGVRTEEFKSIRNLYQNFGK